MMRKIMILNGSPRAIKSNSKKYSEIFIKKSNLSVQYFNITKLNHLNLCDKMSEFSDVLLVFPLYADSLPTTLFEFLKVLENNLPINKPTISVLINCGFLEYQQNDLAVDMIRYYCQINGFPFGSALKIGSGEAILQTPFKIFVELKIKQLANSILKQKYQELSFSMPISKKLFLKASTNYWLKYGQIYNTTEAEMRTMKIEE